MKGVSEINGKIRMNISPGKTSRNGFSAQLHASNHRIITCPWNTGSLVPLGDVKSLNMRYCFLRRCWTNVNSKLEVIHCEDLYLFVNNSCSKAKVRSILLGLPWQTDTFICHTHCTIPSLFTHCQPICLKHIGPVCPRHYSRNWARYTGELIRRGPICKKLRV